MSTNYKTIFSYCIRIELYMNQYVCLFDLILYVPVNNFSVMQFVSYVGTDIPGFDQY